MPEADTVVEVVPFVVRAAVHERARHLFEQRPPWAGRPPAGVKEAGDAAHAQDLAPTAVSRSGRLIANPAPHARVDRVGTGSPNRERMQTRGATAQFPGGCHSQGSGQFHEQRAWAGSRPPREAHDVHRNGALPRPRAALTPDRPFATYENMRA